MSFNDFQNVSSRLTLVLCPAITMERLTTDDFMLAVSSLEEPAPPRETLTRIGGPPVQRLVVSGVVVAMHLVELLPTTIPGWPDKSYGLPFEICCLRSVRHALPIDVC